MVAPGMLALVASTTCPTMVAVGACPSMMVENAGSQPKHTMLILVCIANYPPKCGQSFRPFVLIERGFGRPIYFPALLSDYWLPVALDAALF
jgi:hypothetical protein